MKLIQYFLCITSRCVKIRGLLPAICKPRHWNIGIGIGIGSASGTNTTNAIISSSIRPMDTNPSRVVIYDEGTPPIKSRDTSTTN